MTYIVNDNCIKCKLTDCVDVCPVDCFYEGKNMLVIKPDECIDCGVCEPECPVDAIKADTEPGRGHGVIFVGFAETKNQPITRRVRQARQVESGFKKFNADDAFTI